MTTTTQHQQTLLNEEQQKQQQFLPPVRQLAWHEEPLIRLSGCFDHSAIYCVSRTFLRGNPNWLFYKMFSDTWNEPVHEMRQLDGTGSGGGRLVKVYCLNIPEPALKTMIALMWQPNAEHFDVATAAEIHRNTPSLKKSIPLASWFEILRYYGFMLCAEEVESLEDSIPDINKLSPPCKFYSKLMDIMISHVFTKSPGWNGFIKGELTTIHFQFAGTRESVANQDELHHHLHQTSLESDNHREQSFSAFYISQKLSALSSMRDNELILERRLEQYNPMLGSCKVKIFEPIGNAEVDRTINHWPLTHDMKRQQDVDPCCDVATGGPIHKNTVLPVGYYIVTVTISW